MKTKIDDIINKFKENDCKLARTTFKKIDTLHIPDKFEIDDDFQYVLPIIKAIIADKELNKVYARTLNDKIKCFFNKTMVKYDDFNSKEKTCIKKL